MNKLKVFNDPVHGFIRIPHNIIFDIIEHPYFQRLRRIKQLGLTDYVYPGAFHTRFHHALGAFHLMYKAINTLRFKGVHISEDEEKAALIAILLHDIGHGPFSHTLENCLINNVSHEAISNIYMKYLNKEFNGALELAIKIFRNQYEKKFLHQLVSSQLDVDRLDYLSRDSFFTGVSEGVVNFNRIIDMMHVHDGNLVIEEKGIYSVEKFLVSRRLMYWQVYLHKTVVCAEEMLIKLLERANDLAGKGVEVDAPKYLMFFLVNEVTRKDFDKKEVLHNFSMLDDSDFYTAMKQWTHHDDKVLRFLSNALLHRKLLKIKLFDEAPNEAVITKKKKAAQQFGFSDDELRYLVFSRKMTNYIYHPTQAGIGILDKKGKVTDISKANDQWNVSTLTQPVSKYYVCFPKPHP